MRKISILLASLAVATIPAAADNLADYVYPGNAPQGAPAITWCPDGLSYLTLTADGKSIVKIDAKSGKEVETIFDATHTRETTIDRAIGFTLSPEGSRLLIKTSSEGIYRRSSRGAHYVYEIRSRILRPLSDVHKTQQSPLFSPDGRMVAFVDSNNIYIRKVDFNTEVAVTRDGKINEVINGVPDWTYEEEFDTTCSMAWSPDNATLCYLRYDESAVPMYRLPIYEGACDPQSQYALYPGSLDYKYPVAGAHNSVVTLHSYDVDNRKIKKISLPEGYEYIPRIMFTPASEQLLAVTLNRDQTRMEVYGVNPRSTTVKSVLVEQAKGGWITPETYEQITMLPQSFVLNSNRSGHAHLYEYAYNGSLLRQVTSGDYDVTAFYGCDDAQTFYYQSTATGVINRVVNALDRKGRVSNLSPAEGTASANFGPGMHYAVLNHSTSAKAPRVSMCDPSGKVLRTLVDNKEYQARYASSPSREFITLNAGALVLNASVVRPVDFNASRKYPVIINQYSGPGSQQVCNRWAADWTLWYATRGYIVVTVDPRGTAGRGNAFLYADYRDLGSATTTDLIACVEALKGVPGCDTDRVGIYGWSFGGYQALMCATAQNTPFKATVAVAPVTDWRYYDTAYTERYMLTPQQNPLGYKTSAPLGRVHNLSGKLLLMWGTLDDNVHPANSLEFVSRLAQEGKWPEILPFVNQNHSIYGCNLREVVYSRMLDFFDRNL